MSYYQRFLVSLSDLTNIVNVCTDDHVSHDRISALLEELGIEGHPDPSSMGTGLGRVASHIASPSTTAKGKTKPEQSHPPSSSPPRSSRELDPLDDCSSELIGGFGNMSISRPNTNPRPKPERTWDTRRTNSIIGIVAAQCRCAQAMRPHPRGCSSESSGALAQPSLAECRTTLHRGGKRR